MKSKRLIMGFGLFFGGSFSVLAQSSLIALNDHELGDIAGQALMSLTYISPSDEKNLQTQHAPESKVGFYKLGMEADIELNANIRKLQLGCGGTNNTNRCDIDFDHFSLSGISDTRDGRVSSDALLSNPFIEFAIKNPDKAATRSVEGVRLSAEKVFAMLTIGSENTNTPNGINSFSGYMKLAPATGTAQTQTRLMSNKIGQMSGRIAIQDVPLFNPSPRNFKADSYNLTLHQTDVPFTTRVKEINGSHINSVNLFADAVIPNINFDGPLKAEIKVLNFLPVTLSKNVTGTIENLGVNIEIEQNLGMIHRIPVNGNAFSLSLQNNRLHWPGATVAANPGWWMAFENEIEIGSVSPSKEIVVTDDLLRQVLPKINAYLYDNPIICKGLSGCIGGNLPITNPIDLDGQRVNLPLSNLRLSAQEFAPNCYGNLKFC